MSQQFTQEQQDQLLFMMLIQQHQQIAKMGLGQEKNPSTGEVEKDLKSAKFSIDTLHVLQKFTKGNLTQELSEYLDKTVKELRVGYQEAAEDEGPATNGSDATNNPDS